MHRNKSVQTHQFAMVPRADIPRSSFRMQKAYKTTFDGGILYPIFCEEILPGDTFNVKMTAFARLATPIFPFMDNIHFESFFFFVPNRLTWVNWKKFMGEQDAPGDSVSYTVPQVVSGVGGFPVLTIYDYFGLPVPDQVDPASTVSVNALPLRAYNLIYNQWFRDENLVTPATILNGDATDPVNTYALRRRGKRHDYFTSALPWVQKGPSVTLPLGDTAPVMGIGISNSMGGGGPLPGPYTQADGTSGAMQGWAFGGDGAFASVDTVGPTPLIYADLSLATASTINQIRQAFQIQKLLERDARGGTRYTELVRAHFGVISPDARLQRPEYLGGGHSPISVNAVPQTSGSPGAGAYTDTPQGNLAAFATMLAHGHGFTQSFTEHGYVIGIICARADLTYQQGLRRHWSRQTRYDYYFPVFAALGEQPIYNREIYVDGTAADAEVFGYQERWAEYRYNPSEITALMRSTHPQTLDAWHLAQNFLTRPSLNQQFIEEYPPIERVVAVGAEAAGQQFLLDCFFDIKAARPMPMYSVPGLVDHF